jgi:putative glutamine amidotransferase
MDNNFMKKPVIGVLPLFDSEKESLWMLPGYMEGVEAAGGMPVMLSLTANEETVKSWAAHLDGFLFTGGQDVDPAVYGEDKHPFCGEICPQRDKIERILLNEIIRIDKPAFGICRGLQFFNAALGGTLYQDIPAQLHSDVTIRHEQKKPYDVPCHKVRIAAGSPLFELLKKDALMVNSLHHQGVKKLAGRLRAAALSEDGLVEAAYQPGAKCIFAVQWHPECSFQKDPDALKLFRCFVAAAKRE